jgi:thiol:disulfide interchange protein DsbC
MKIKQFWATLALVAASVGAVAQTPAVPQSAPAMSVSPEVVMAKLKATFVNTPFSEVRATPIAGIYEVAMGKDIAYTDSTGRYFMFGNVMDMNTQRNLTQERRSELTKVDVSQVNTADAIKTVKGDGSRVLYVFSDPECRYCKALEPTLQQMTNVTIYTFLYPVLGEASTQSAKAVWCSKDRNKAWADHMLRGVNGLPGECDNPIQRNVQLGSSFGISGTPTLMSADGKLLPGAVPLDRIEAFIASSTTVTATAKVK